MYSYRPPGEHTLTASYISPLFVSRRKREKTTARSRLQQQWMECSCSTLQHTLAPAKMADRPQRATVTRAHTSAASRLLAAAGYRNYSRCARARQPRQRQRTGSSTPGGSSMHAIHIYVVARDGKPIHTLADTAWPDGQRECTWLGRLAN